MTEEAYKLKEELRAKSGLIKSDIEDSQIGKFSLKQEIEKLNHELLMAKNQNYEMKSEIDTEKFKSKQLTSALESRDKSYAELKLQVNDLQYKLDKARRENTTDYLSNRNEYKYSNSIYESPFNNIVSSLSAIKGIETDTQYKVDQPVAVSPSADTSAQPNPSRFINKNQSSEIMSNSMGGSLNWNNSNDLQSHGNTTDRRGDQSQNTGESALQTKMRELQFNISEETRLADLIKNPPVQYRKHQKQQELKEDLKKAQRNIYELNFYIKSHS